MKVRVTFDLSDSVRRGINARYGRPGLATREQCASEIHSLATADLEVMEAEARAADADEES